jgi:hypothetical protein
MEERMQLTIRIVGTSMPAAVRPAANELARRMGEAMKGPIILPNQEPGAATFTHKIDELQPLFGSWGLAIVLSELMEKPDRQYEIGLDRMALLCLYFIRGVFTQHQRVESFIGIHTNMYHYERGPAMIPGERESELSRIEIPWPTFDPSIPETGTFRMPQSLQAVTALGHLGGPREGGRG